MTSTILKPVRTLRFCKSNLAYSVNRTPNEFMLFSLFCEPSGLRTHSRTQRFKQRRTPLCDFASTGQVNPCRTMPNPTCDPSACKPPNFFGLIPNFEQPIFIPIARCLRSFCRARSPPNQAAHAEDELSLSNSLAAVELLLAAEQRHMGTIVGTSDFDSLRWPNSKWRNLQVEWDDSGYDERPDRVSVWEIETPESLFVFPPSLKRHCIPGLMGMDIGAGNVKHFLQASDYRSDDLHTLRSKLDSERLMKKKMKQQNSLPGSEIGCHQSIFATVLQKCKASGFSATSSSTLPILMSTQGSSSHEEIIIQTSMREKHTSLGPQEQLLPLEDNTSLENQNIYYYLEQQGLLMSTKLVSQSSAETPWRNCQEVNEHGNKFEDDIVEKIDIKSELLYDEAKNERMEPAQNKVKTTSDMSQLSGNFERFSPATYPVNEINKNENLKSSSVAENKEVQPNRLDDLQIYQQQLGIEAADPLNKNLPFHGCQLYQCSDNEELMLQHSVYQSFAPNILLNSSRPDHLFLSTVENAESPSVAMSSILNLESLNPFEKCQFSSFSDAFSPSFMPIFAEEAYGYREINPSEGIPVTSILSSHAQNLKTGMKENVSPELLKLCGLRDSPSEGTCSNLHSESSNADIFTDSSVPNKVLEEFSVVKGSSFPVTLEDSFGCFAMNQDIQSQLTSTSLADFSLQDIPESSAGTSSGNFDANDYNYLGKQAMKQVVQQPMRTYTKVQKLGSVGRSIDLKRFRNYKQLKSAIVCMFGLEGQLDDPKHSEWKLVYVDQENDVLLVGDDPWDEFVNCVRCIRILSPSEVQQMSEEGKFMNSYLP